MSDVTEVAIGEVKGRRVVLSAGREGLVQVRDAGTLRPIGKPIPGLTSRAASSWTWPPGAW
ncbi:hypothetical protein [Nonomuraea sp. NPDC049400]|uniref:hypothetical protein n=1 Tax=Nonomuraea sp. NPDC049400 TaxID=3364352 RepID=UPI0037944018